MAEMAQRWADQCEYEYGGTTGSHWSNVGQNIAFGYRRFENRDGVVATNIWHAEGADYTYDAPCESGKVCGYCTYGTCGDYTQVRFY